MAVSHNRKSPGKLWYGMQYAKAIVPALKDKRAKDPTKDMIQDSGKAVGVQGVVYAATTYVPFLAAFTMPIDLGGAAVSFVLARNAYTAGKEFKKSNVVRDYIRAQEEQWKRDQMRPPLKERMATAVDNFTFKFRHPIKAWKGETPTDKLAEVSKTTTPSVMEAQNDNKRANSAPLTQSFNAPEKPTQKEPVPLTAEQEAARKARQANRKRHNGF